MPGKSQSRCNLIPVYATLILHGLSRSLKSSSHLRIYLLDMASGDASSAAKVKVLLSFYLSATDEDTVRAAAIHKEKFNVPLSLEHKELYKFQKHLKSFTDLEQMARSKGLGENPEVTIARVQKAGSGVETFSLRTQDAWQCDFDALIRGNGMLQG